MGGREAIENRLGCFGLRLTYQLLKFLASPLESVYIRKLSHSWPKYLIGDPMLQHSERYTKILKYVRGRSGAVPCKFSKPHTVCTAQIYYMAILILCANSDIILYLETSTRTADKDTSQRKQSHFAIYIFDVFLYLVDLS